MNDTLVIGTGQAHELALALARNGHNNTEVKRPSEGDTFAKVRQVLLGHAEIKIVEHVIDCDADPVIPQGYNWTIEEHRKGGQMKWEPEKIMLHLSKNQKGDKVIEGNKLRKELAGELVLNANVLDYLLQNPHLIPEEWKKDENGNTRYIYFWGTIYRNSYGFLFVRCLCWRGGMWVWRYIWLGRGWGGQDPAALLAK